VKYSIVKSITTSLLFLLSHFTLANVDESQTKFIPTLTVEDFVAEADFRDAEISPNGRFLAMILSENKARYVIIRDLESEGSPVIGSLGDIIYRPTEIEWANDERLLVKFLVPLDPGRVKRQLVSKEDFDIYDYPMTTRMMSVDVNGKNSVILMKNRKVSSFVSHYLTEDKEHVLMPYMYKHTYALEKVNIYTGENELYTRGNWRTYRILTDNKGNLLYRLDYLNSSNETQIFKYTDENEWEEIDRINFDDVEAEDKENDAELVFFGLSEDSSLVYRQMNQSTGFCEIVEINKKDKSKKVVASFPDRDVVSLITDKRTDRFVGYKTQKDLLESHYFNKEMQGHYDAASKQVGNNNIWFNWPVGGSKKAIISASGPENRGQFILFDSETNKLKLIGDKYKKFKADNLAIPAVSNLKMRDGTEIRAYILFPPNFQDGKPMPMVVLPHSHPHSRDSAKFHYLAQFIATRGYIVLQPNFRGSAGYGLAFKSAGFKQWGGLMQDDITDSVKYMINEGFALKDKICIAGISYGGYAALMGAVKTPELYQCSISINGITNLEEHIELKINGASDKDRAEITDTLYKEIGNLQTDIDMLRSNSPALRANEVKASVLMIVGVEDSLVYHGQTKQMYKALRKAGKDVEKFSIRKGGHNVFYYVDRKTEVLNELEAFLAKHLSL